MFVREFAGTLVTIAKDVKIQVEFNPAKVAAYRLVGYENRALRNEDFADDTKDAGELGAGHTVTALYEIVPVGASFAGTGGDLDSLKYQTVSASARGGPKRRWLTVQLRYKEPDGVTSRLLTHPVRVRGDLGEPEGDFRFATAVAGFGLVLRQSEYRGTATWIRYWRWRAGPRMTTPTASAVSSFGWWNRPGCCIWRTRARRSTRAMPLAGACRGNGDVVQPAQPNGPPVREARKSLWPLEAPPRFELGVEVLQTSALPLGYGAGGRQK